MFHSAKKLTALLLAGMMLLPLASCANSKDDDKQGESTQQGTVAEEETLDPNYRTDLPNDLDFENTEVNIMCVKVDGRADDLIS